MTNCHMHKEKTSPKFDTSFKIFVILLIVGLSIAPIGYFDSENKLLWIWGGLGIAFLPLVVIGGISAIREHYKFKSYSCRRCRDSGYWYYRGQRLSYPIGCSICGKFPDPPNCTHLYEGSTLCSICDRLLCERCVMYHIKHHNARGDNKIEYDSKTVISF